MHAMCAAAIDRVKPKNWKIIRAEHINASESYIKALYNSFPEINDGSIGTREFALNIYDIANVQFNSKVDVSRWLTQSKCTTTIYAQAKQVNKMINDAGL